VLPALGQGSEPFRLVVGYSRSAVQDVYVEDGKRVVKAMIGGYLAAAEARLQAELITFEDNAQLKEAVTHKRVDLVGAASNQIVDMARGGAIEPAMVTEMSGGVYDDAVLLVKKDAGIVNLGDLRGKRLMTLEGAAMGHPYLWLETWALREEHGVVGSLVGSVREGRTSSQVILACFFASADACLVPRGGFDLARELNPQIAERLRILGNSAGLIGAIVAFRSDYDPVARAHLIQLMAHLEEDTRGKQILNLFRRTRLVLFKPGYLVGIAELVAEHDRLLNVTGQVYKSPKGSPR
jgi:ABC-type phosphate/phosphonate transport system substrate-binding protein